MAVTARSAALSKIVGESRAFLLQLEHWRSDLVELQDPELGPLVAALVEVETSLEAVERLGTKKLKANR